MVVKKNFRREFFNRDKILSGLTKACKKRNITGEQLATIVDKIEGEVFEEHDNEVETRFIGEKVSKYLKQLDPVAYVRFASVYREFSEIRQFLHQVRELEVVAPPGVDPSKQKS